MTNDVNRLRSYSNAIKANAPRLSDTILTSPQLQMGTTSEFRSAAKTDDSTIKKILPFLPDKKEQVKQSKEIQQNSRAHVNELKRTNTQMISLNKIMSQQVVLSSQILYALKSIQKMSSATAAASGASPAAVAGAGSTSSGGGIFGMVAGGVLAAGAAIMGGKAIANSINPQASEANVQTPGFFPESGPRGAQPPRLRDGSSGSPHYGKPYASTNQTGNPAIDNTVDASGIKLYQQPGVKPEPDSTGLSKFRSDVDPDGRPASIRYNNPGAAWPSKEDERYGIKGYGVLTDPKTGQQNQIGRFPSATHGAAANMALFARKYVGMTMGEATKMWRGNNAGSNIMPEGMDPNMRITPEMAKDPIFMKKLFRSFAGHEAGKKGSISDQELDQAFDWYKKGGADGTPALGRNANAEQLTNAQQYLQEQLKTAPEADKPKVQQQIDELGKLQEQLKNKPQYGSAPNITPQQQQNRPDYWRGSLKFGDQTYRYGTGVPNAPGGTPETGGNSGSVPLGQFDIKRGLHYGKNPRFQNNSFYVKDMFDAKWGRNRSAVLFHSARDLDKMYSAGCFAIDPRQWPKFRAQMLQTMQKHGDLVVRVNPDGSAQILPKSEAKNGTPGLPTSTPKTPENFIANNPANNSNPSSTSGTTNTNNKENLPTIGPAKGEAGYVAPNDKENLPTIGPAKGEAGYVAPNDAQILTPPNSSIPKQLQPETSTPAAPAPATPTPAEPPRSNPDIREVKSESKDSFFDNKSSQNGWAPSVMNYWKQGKEGINV